jgi:histidine triad (HIT) family protein
MVCTLLITNNKVAMLQMKIYACRGKLGDNIRAFKEAILTMTRKNKLMQSFVPTETSLDCAFCKIVRSEAQSYNVFEDDIALAFLDKRPLFPGHCLLIPKSHYETLIDLPASLVAPLFQNAQLLAHAMEKGLQAEGTFVAINNRISQSVPHLHIHIVPRHTKDGLKGFFWPRQHYQDEAAILGIQDTLRSTITQLKSETQS